MLTVCSLVKGLRKIRKEIRITNTLPNVEILFDGILISFVSSLCCSWFGYRCFDLGRPSEPCCWRLLFGGCCSSNRFTFNNRGGLGIYQFSWNWTELLDIYKRKKREQTTLSCLNFPSWSLKLFSYPRFGDRYCLRHDDLLSYPSLGNRYILSPGSVTRRHNNQSTGKGYYNNWRRHVELMLSMAGRTVFIICTWCSLYMPENWRTIKGIWCGVWTNPHAG